MKTVFTGISVIFHPIFMPLFGLYLALNADAYLYFQMYPSKAFITYIIVGLSTIVFPLISILLLFRSGLISDVQISERKERLRPFISTLIYYLLGYYLLRRGLLPAAVYSMFIGAIISLTLIILISLKWKISAHAAGVFGVLGILSGLYMLYGTIQSIPIAFTLILGSIIMSARIYSGSHTPAQVYTGALLGFCSCFIPVYYLWFI